LGGHYAKAHPNCSERYKQKIATSKKRKGDRALFIAAKTYLIKYDNDGQPDSLKKSKIAMTKKKLFKIMNSDEKPSLSQSVEILER